MLSSFRPMEATSPNFSSKTDWPVFMEHEHRCRTAQIRGHIWPVFVAMK